MIQVRGCPGLLIQWLCYPQECCPRLHGRTDHGYCHDPALRMVSSSLGLGLVFWANEAHTSLPFLLRRWWLGHLAPHPLGQPVMRGSCTPRMCSLTLTPTEKRTDFGGQRAALLTTTNLESGVLPGLAGRRWGRRPVVLAPIEFTVWWGRKELSREAIPKRNGPGRGWRRCQDKDKKRAYETEAPNAPSPWRNKG